MSPTTSISSAPPKEAEVVNNEEKPNHEERELNLKDPKFWLVIMGMYMAIFLVALDRLIIATAIAKITDEFDSIQDIGWYGSAYMLTAGIFNPLFGRIYQYYPTKWVFLICITVFEIGSAICGAAPTSTTFIIGRAIAGIGAAGIQCGGIMIIIPLVPLQKRPVFVSFFGLAFGISSVLGPIVGGLFTDNKHLTWRWCFYINLPIGAFTVIAMLFFLHLDSPKREKLSLVGQLKRLDPLGLFFFIPSIVCLILVLQWGGTTYAWSAPKMIGLLVTFAVTFILFLIVETLMPDTAMVPMRIVTNRSVAGAMFFLLLLAGGMMPIVYYLSVWFQASQGVSAVESGIRTIPLVICLVIFGIAAGVFTQKVGYYVPALLLSPILTSIGAGLLSTLTPSSHANKWIGYQVLYGTGLGVGFQTSTLVPQTVLPRTDVSIGMALMFFMQQFGGAIFTSVGQNIFSQKLVDELTGVAGLDVETIVNTGATALRGIVSPSQLITVINAYSFALIRVFVMAAALSAAMMIGALAVEWKSIKAKKSTPSNDVEADTEDVKGEQKA